MVFAFVFFVILIGSWAAWEFISSPVVTDDRYEEFSTRHDMTRRDETGLGETRPDGTRQDVTRQDLIFSGDNDAA
jgi:hypothetical protein